MLARGGRDPFDHARGCARLETGPASLYTFVRDQRELHVLVLDSLAARVPLAPAGADEGSEIVALLLDYARWLHAFPGAARLALLTPPTGPAFLDLLERAMGLLVGEGLSVAAAERACDALFLLVTATVAEHDAPRPDEPARSIPGLYEEALDADSTSPPASGCRAEGDAKRGWRAATRVVSAGVPRRRESEFPGTVSPAPTPRTYTSLRAAWIPLAALCMAFFVEMVDNSLLSIAFPTIGRDLGSGTTALQWVTGAYSLTFGGLLLTAGSVADRFGRRRVLLVGLALFGLLSLLVIAVTRPANSSLSGQRSASPQR